MPDTTHRATRRILLIGGVVALGAAICVEGTRPTSAIIGGNGVAPEAFVAVVPANKVLCQGDQSLVRGTDALAMTIGTHGRTGQRVQAELRDAHDAVLARGRLRPGYEQGPVSLQLDRRVPRDVARARICLANRGTHDIAIAGASTSRARAARIGRRVAGGRISAVYTARRDSHLARAGEIAAAMTGPGLWGGLAPWAAGALAALTTLAVVRTLW